MHTQAEIVLEQLSWYKYPYWRLYRNDSRSQVVHMYPLRPDDGGPASYDPSREHLEKVLAMLPPGTWFLKADKSDKFNNSVNWTFTKSVDGSAISQVGALPAAPPAAPPVDVDTIRRLGELEAETRLSSKIGALEQQMRDMVAAQEKEALKREYELKLAEATKTSKLDQILEQVLPLLIAVVTKSPKAAAAAVVAKGVAGAAPSTPPDTPAPDSEEVAISNAVQILAEKAGGYDRVAASLQKLAELPPEQLQMLMQNI
jgi:hypothetical protein